MLVCLEATVSKPNAVAYAHIDKQCVMKNCFTKNPKIIQQKCSLSRFGNTIGRFTITLLVINQSDASDRAKLPDDECKNQRDCNKTIRESNRAKYNPVNNVKGKCNGNFRLNKTL